MTNLLDRTIAYLLPKRGLKRAEARRRLELANSYKGAESNRLRGDWLNLGAYYDSQQDFYELETLRLRSRDLNRNDPVASGATGTMAINIVGQGLTPQSKLRAEILGLTSDKAAAVQKQIENVWADWIINADAANRLDFSEIQALALRKIIEDGEIIVIPAWVDDPWRKLRRAVELVESDRLATDDYRALSTDWKAMSGITFGSRGEPLTYSIKKSVESTEFIKISARDAQGRPNILHVFPTLRPGQVRGVPHFAPVINYFKDLADYLEAEVVAARVAACLAVFVTAADPMNLASMAAVTTETSTGNRLQALEPGLVGYLNPGESVNVVDPKRPGDAFPSFVESVLRIIGVSLGLPYELLVKDFSKTNYSSARAALLEGRRTFTNWRAWFARKFCQPIFNLVVEEAYLRGIIDAPKFYDFKSEYCRVFWIGGAWGWVDPVKEVEASKKAIDYGLSTMAEEAAGQGRDWEEVLDQRAREEAKAKELGLVLSPLKASPGPPAGEKDDDETETE